MPHSSTDCCPSRLEWRPSRLAAIGAAALVIGCALALLGTRWAEALPLAVQALLLSASLPLAGLAAWRVLARRAWVLELWPETAATVHEHWPVTLVRLHPKGPTAVFWPDTLCDSGRRTLRRWAGAAPEASPLSQFWMG